MAKKATKTAAKKVAKNKTEELAEASKQELSTAVNFADDAGVGCEDMTKDDMTIPRISILQSLSPQVQKTDDKFIEGAEAGNLLDTVRLETISGEEGVLIIPISYRTTYIEWKTRKNGGGFVADHGNDRSVLKSCQRNEETGAMINSDGNQIVQTAEYYAFKVDPETGDASPLVLSMSGSQIKHSRRLNTMINMKREPHPSGQGSFNPAMFYSAFTFRTKPESNDQGSWFGWDIESHSNTIDLPNGNQIYLDARAFREQVKEGAVKPHQEPSPAVDDDTPM